MRQSVIVPIFLLFGILLISISSAEAQSIEAHLHKFFTLLYDQDELALDMLHPAVYEVTPRSTFEEELKTGTTKEERQLGGYESVKVDTMATYSTDSTEVVLFMANKTMYMDYCLQKTVPGIEEVIAQTQQMLETSMGKDKVWYDEAKYRLYYISDVPYYAIKGKDVAAEWKFINHSPQMQKAIDKVVPEAIQYRNPE